MPQIKNFDEAHAALASYIGQAKQYGNYKLDRMNKLMSYLGNPQDNYKVIHVAGTSGKTSTCYYIASLLLSAGQKVGLTVSPHVDEVNERVQINMQPLAEKQFCEQLSVFIELVGLSKIEPSYFELLVAFAFWQFDKQKVDYAVVEVGLGGLLDGTNVIHRPDKICVITDIGLDHTSVLGKSIKEIAFQKAGIIQDHNFVFMYKQSADIMMQVKARCSQQHATLSQIKYIAAENFKKHNYLLAKKVYDFIAQNQGWPRLKMQAIDDSKNLTIPARMEVVYFKGKTVIIDGSHNGQKIMALVKAVKYDFGAKPAAALISFVDTDLERMPAALQQLKLLTNKVIITSFVDIQDTPKKSVDTKLLVELTRQARFSEIIVTEDPKKAFFELLKQSEDILVVTGSFYLLNHIRPLVKL